MSGETCGDLVAINIGDGGSPEAFSLIAGMQSKSFTINDEQVDITNSDNGKWRQLLGGCGIKSMSITGSGISTDDANEDAMIDLIMAGTLNNYQIVTARGTFEGLFQISTQGGGGEYNQAQTWEFTLESAGDITFTATT